MNLAGYDLGEKVAIVTGASGGIGRAVVACLRQAGARVVAADLRKPTNLGDVDIQLDVAREEGWATAVGAATARFGRVDILVNGAGIFRPMPIMQESADHFLRHVQVNQLGVFLGMRAVQPAMQAAGGGAIVNISSAAGLIGTTNTISYTGTKWAVRGMTKTAALEWASLRIRVNSVHPGPVDTPMVTDLPGSENAGKGSAMGRMAQPEEVARMVLFLASDASSYSTGSEFICDGGISAA